MSLEAFDTVIIIVTDDVTKYKLSSAGRAKADSLYSIDGQTVIAIQFKVQFNCDKRVIWSFKDLI